VAGRRAYDVEYRVRRHDGTYGWFKTRGVPIRDSNGNIVKWFGSCTDITDRKRAEEALRESEQELRKARNELEKKVAERTAELRRSEAYLAEAIGIAHIGYWERYPAAKLINWSEETLRIFGLLPGSGPVTFERFRELVHPDDWQRIIAAQAEAETLRSGERYDTEFRAVRPNGEVRIVHTRGNVTRDEAGRIRRIFGIVEDLTERKLVEAALLERAELLDLTHDTIFVRGMNDAISFWNRGAEQLYGWNKEEVLGQISHQLLRTIFPSPLEGITSELLSTGRWEGELVHTKRDGTQVTVASRWSLRQDERGRPVGILETNNDITERKRAEYLTSQVFESSPDSMAIIGTDYRLQRVNPVFERFWGKPAATVFGMHIAEITGTEFFEQKGKPNLDRCFAGEEVNFADWYATSGGRRYRVVSHSPLRPDTQRAEAALLIARDFTDYVQASEALREAQTELAHVNRVATMGQLTASIAHEVNQPIAAAVTEADAGLRFLAAQPPDLKEVRDALDAIMKAGNRAGEVISRIRGLIKKVPEQKAPLDVNEAILETIALTRSEMRQHGILLKTELANDVPQILGDRVQLQQVILNLIMNAIEAMSETSQGPRELLVRSEIDVPDGVMVTVRDWGPGFKPESLNHLFDPFYTTKPAGMGMGLSICRSIIEAHGGRLWTTANTPRGAVFQFTLH
jgi:PAS domain S-box-containing protein